MAVLTAFGFRSLRGVGGDASGLIQGRRAATFVVTAARCCRCGRESSGSPKQVVEN